MINNYNGVWVNPNKRGYWNVAISLKYITDTSVVSKCSKLKCYAHFLGMYPNEIEAKIVYDRAVILYYKQTNPTLYYPIWVYTPWIQLCQEYSYDETKLDPRTGCLLKYRYRSDCCFSNTDTTSYFLPPHVEITWLSDMSSFFNSEILNFLRIL